MTTKKQLKRSNIGYIRGCKGAVDMLLREALTRHMTPEQGMHLLTIFSIHVETMVKKKDIDPPFLSRAMAKSIEQMRLDDYETALTKITGQPVVSSP